jgi:ATP-dependent RNA helicase RhlE
MGRALVFTRTKRGADRVAKYLEGAGISAAAIHGDKSQGQRERALAAFKAGKVRALVATDIAARGIDVDAVTHVVNFELPNVPEAYVHRIGRTARAGADGVAISLCADDERGLLKDIQKVTRQTIPAFDRRNDLRALKAGGLSRPLPGPRRVAQNAAASRQPAMMPVVRSRTSVRPKVASRTAAVRQSAAAGRTRPSRPCSSRPPPAPRPAPPGARSWPAARRRA